MISYLQLFWKISIEILSSPSGSWCVLSIDNWALLLRHFYNCNPNAKYKRFRQGHYGHIIIVRIFIEIWMLVYMWNVDFLTAGAFKGRSRSDWQICWLSTANFYSVLIRSDSKFLDCSPVSAVGCSENVPGWYDWSSTMVITFYSYGDLVWVIRYIGCIAANNSEATSLNIRITPCLKWAISDFNIGQAPKKWYKSLWSHCLIQQL